MTSAEFCEIEVTLRGSTERAYKVSCSSFKYTNNYQASLYDDLFVIPKSQIQHMRHLGNERVIMKLPKWLIRKIGLHTK